MASSARIDEIKKKFDENPRRYFAPLANEFRKAGDLDQAILICEEFLPQQPGHMSGHIVYGQSLFEAGRLAESRTVFETALGLDPENLIALRHLGDIAHADGDLAGARRWYDRVLEADPRNEEIQGLIAALEPAPGPAPEPAAPAREPWESPEAPAPTPAAALDAIDAIEPIAPQGAPPEFHAPAPELAPIDLDLDDASFAPTAAAPVAPAPTPASDAGGFDAITLDDLESTNAEAETAAGMPSSHPRAEGLEPSEFEIPGVTHERAEGLESSEFEVPAEAPSRAEGLETSEFSVPAGVEASALPDLESSFANEVGTIDDAASTTGAPLAGLEEAGATHPPAADEPLMPSLDLDEGLAVPPHGDAMMAGAPAATPDVPLGQAAARGTGNPRMDPPAAMEAMPALELEDLSVPPAPAETAAEPAMLELPPEVIAAESALMDVAPGAEASDDYPDDTGYVAAAPSAPFVTETMAELYEKQGFHAQALDVYRQLAAASPHDERLRGRVHQLEQAGGAPVGQEVQETGPTTREFFFRLATLRPGARAVQDAPPADDDFATGAGDAAGAPPALDDFASFDAIAETPAPVVESSVTTSSSLDFIYQPEPEPAQEAAPAPPVPEAPRAPHLTPAAVSAIETMPSAAERGNTALGPRKSGGGTIDALFGTKATNTSEDSAASALAQAFGGTAETPAITGRPARAANSELSLDSVFRDAPPRPPRPSQNFSFDQFFSESATSESAASQVPSEGASTAEPAERTADDVKQFNSWLQGLKPR